MAKQAPTQSRLLELKEQLDRAEEGYDLLERKRDVLINELMSRIRNLKNLRNEFEENFVQGLEFFKEAYIEMGEINLELALNTNPKPIVVKTLDRSVMGVIIQEFKEYDIELIDEPGVSISNPNFHKSLDKASEAFKSLIKYIEKYNAVWKIAQEIKKTLKRVNALENITIPQYKSDITWIEDVLEENEREQFFRQKQVKKKMEQK